MIRTRELFRKSADQKSLDKNGFVVVDFFQNQNYNWLHDVYKTSTISGNSIQLQDDLNDKLQSKVEYRLINCSPVFYEFESFIKASHKIELNASITMENKQASIMLLVPFFSSDKEFCSISLFSSTSKNIFPRTKTEIEPPTNNDLRATVKLKYGEALFIMNHSPYYIHRNEIGYFLKVLVLPYESKPFLFLQKNNSVLPLQSSSENFVRYLLGEKSLTDKMIKRPPLEGINSVTFEDLKVVVPARIPLLFRKLKTLLW